ncbi:hypothetical protein AB0L63_23780 [Nocardia sp. NPDC051990]|uniref:hypothetical protein n=1 Tax=Nocardia sp. NPDC051990 TaxID=3155285 RepID=UPI003432CB95
MKRGVYAALGVLAIAAAVVGGPAAHAAQGTLVVNGTVYRGPSGCLRIGGSAAPLAIENHTDATVTVFAMAGCKGEAGAALPSGASRTFSGSSILVS